MGGRFRPFDWLGVLRTTAAAYLYHLVKNHPFVDGNKRAGALSFLFFLKKNAPEKVPGPVELERVILAVAESSMSKEEVVGWVRGLGGVGE